MGNDINFSCERRLRKLDFTLHNKYRESVFAVQHMLRNYRAVFPDFTDHSYLHCLDIMELCNQLIGENLSCMNAGEIYVLLMGIILHDIGMGVSEKDFEEFTGKIDMTIYLSEHPESSKASIIREFHHEYSGLLIQKYADFFEIEEGLLFPIMQAARGHRITNLYDEAEYPVQYDAGNYQICVPYLSALIRLADELDICSSRNVELDYGISNIKDEYSKTVWQTHGAVKEMLITGTEIVITTAVLCGKPDIELEKWMDKMQHVIDEVSDVVTKRTAFRLQHRRMKRILENGMPG